MIYELKDSEGVVKLIEVLYDSTEVSIVMEYAEHGTLCKFIKNKEKLLSENEVKNVMRQLLEAARVMHEKNIYHRDLKPQNILVKSEGPQHEVCIADFGYAIRSSNTKELTVKCGTPTYMDPELLDG